MSHRQFETHKHWWRDMRMDGKVVVITGANSGLGLESAKVFAENGQILYSTFLMVIVKPNKSQK